MSEIDYRKIATKLEQGDGCQLKAYLGDMNFVDQAHFLDKVAGAAAGDKDVPKLFIRRGIDREDFKYAENVSKIELAAGISGGSGFFGSWSNELYEMTFNPKTLEQESTCSDVQPAKP